MKKVDNISVKELQEMAEKMYGSLVKADVDISKKIVIVDMPMHYDGEAELLEQGSKQKDIWGINLHPAKYGTDGFVEFESMINLKPGYGNFSRSVDDPAIQAQILAVIDEVVHE
ncbi:hypothetical protein KY385_02230 [Candidatus Parcubacteria bacterium]|nr:hypothetical protein [Candidatus Parcubacteria bacterium]